MGYEPANSNYEDVGYGNVGRHFDDISTRGSRGEYHRVQYLDDDGKLLPDAPPVDISDETLLGMYESMRLARRFDERALSLQRQGRIATYAPLTGQEAAQVASASTLDPDDWMFPTYRDHAAKYIHGQSLSRQLLTLRGHGDGYAIPDGVNLMPEYIPIASQLPQAVGMGMAADYCDDDAVTLAYFGDGATSQGDFHEAMNFAGVFDAPVVFFCNNNQWAISVPRERQTASKTLAQKAEAYGFEGVQVDGTDPLAVFEVTRRAVAKARSPTEHEQRPTLIEAEQYRLSAHTTADDPDRYRDRVPADWEAKDPLPRFEAFLRNTDRLDDERDEEIRSRVESRVADAVDTAETTSREEPAAMFEHVHETMPDRLATQLDEFEQIRERVGDDAFHQE